MVRATRHDTRSPVPYRSCKNFRRGFLSSRKQVHRVVFYSWTVYTKALSTSWVGDPMNVMFRTHGEALSNYANVKEHPTGPQDSRVPCSRNNNDAQGWLADAFHVHVLTMWFVFMMRSISSTCPLWKEPRTSHSRLGVLYVLDPSPAFCAWGHSMWV